MKQAITILLLSLLTACGGGGDDPNEEIDREQAAEQDRKPTERVTNPMPPVPHPGR